MRESGLGRSPSPRRITRLLALADDRAARPADDARTACLLRVEVGAVAIIAIHRDGERAACCDRLGPGSGARHKKVTRGITFHFNIETLAVARSAFRRLIERRTDKTGNDRI
ncbi:MAG: hypothetical protein JWO58_3398 [Chitinophagaceae bacterium]|nr:hypothetical protein [Chitinophagaceae bacterium]